jgi:hypothetical protein
MGGSTALVAAAIYIGRPWSCGRALGAIPADDPHYPFDPHAIVVMWGWLTAILFAPVAWLLIKKGVEGPAIPRIRDGRSAGILVLVVTLFGTPMLAQIPYLRGLPLTFSWPVWLSSILWLLMTTYLCAAALSDEASPRNEVPI